jgi:hypothetical protein
MQVLTGTAMHRAKVSDIRQIDSTALFYDFYENVMPQGCAGNVA